MITLRVKKTVYGALASLCAITSFTGCKSVDDDRIPWSPVYISFPTTGTWDTWGVGGAGQTREFILRDKIPSGFPYTTRMATGFGGVLLVSDYDGQLRAFDLACPVECKATIRIRVMADSGTPRGECPSCHSTYDIFRWGGPLGGIAAEKGYGLTHYIVSPGMNGEHMTITNSYN